MNNSHTIALLVFGFGVAACGSTDAPATSSNGGDGGGGGSSAGSAGSPGIAGGMMGGGPNVAGSSGSGGTGGTAGPTPTGAVNICNGDGCPYGRCNNNSTPTCQSVYPANGAELCKSDGEYCLVTGGAFDFHFWVVRCTSGAASTEACPSSCGFGLGHANCS